MTTPVTQHEGRKYLREVHSATCGETVLADVYEVLEAFGLDGYKQAVGHAVKKLLAAGQRGKGDRKADLLGAIAAINRAIEFDQRKDPGQDEELRELQEDSGFVPSREEIKKVLDKPPEPTTYQDDGGDRSIPFPPQPPGRKPDDALHGHLWGDDDVCLDCGRHRRELTSVWMNKGIKIDCAAVPKNPA